jgi:hypothetical protein
VKENNNNKTFSVESLISWSGLNGERNRDPEKLFFFSSFTNIKWANGKSFKKNEFYSNFLDEMQT